MSSQFPTPEGQKQGRSPCAKGRVPGRAAATTPPESPDDLAGRPEPEAGECTPVSVGRPRPGRRLVKGTEEPAAPLTAEQRLLLLDTWRRSGLPARDFAALVGMSRHTLYSWKMKFEAEGPAGLVDKPRGSGKGSRLPDLTKRSILMLKEANPTWGCQRISDMLLRGPALPASPEAVARVLREAGYELEETPTKPHPDKARQAHASSSSLATSSW